MPRTEDGYLFAEAEKAGSYDPMEYIQVAPEFAKVRGGDEVGIRQFCYAWGLLGWPTGDRLEEPLWWLWAHAANARLVLTLHDYRQSADTTALEKFLTSYQPGDRGGDDLLVPCAEGYSPEIARVPFPEGRDAIETASQLISRLINANARELDAGAAYQVDALTLDKSSGPPSLLAAIYRHLAEIVSGRDVRRCKECRNFFALSDPRQLYCPTPPPWMGKRESVCGIRARKRDERRRQKQAQDATDGRLDP